MFCFRMSQYILESNEVHLLNTCSTHAAPHHDATTTMLDYRQNTIVLVLLTRASQPGFPHLS